MPYVVESRMLDSEGKLRGIARVYVATEERAREIVSQLPTERAWREILLEDMPVEARENILKAVAFRSIEGDS